MTGVNPDELSAAAVEDEDVEEEEKREGSEKAENRGSNHRVREVMIRVRE